MHRSLALDSCSFTFQLTICWRELLCSLSEPQPPAEHLLHTVLEVQHGPEETVLRLLNEDTASSNMHACSLTDTFFHSG